jgi:hypothetical protein
MFTFIDFSSTNATAAQDQGKLFEKLIRDVVNACGYTDIELRAKISSMEYDIKARQKLDSSSLIGEAKAHIKKIDGATLTSFVGKMFPLWMKNKRTLGLFISTSDFTPDAKDYLHIIPENEANLKNIVGLEILDILSREGNYLTVNQIKTKAQNDFNARPGDTLFLVSDRGNYFIQLLIRKDETRPRAFCVYHNDGTNITELEFGRLLKSRIPELEELLFWPSELKGTSFLDSRQSRITTIQGIGWFDYKFPAPPECFVGRTNQIDKFISFVNRSKNQKSRVAVFQILSRSGVGKSSFLLKIQSEITKDKTVSAIADARNFRSSLDLLEFIQEFIQSSNNIYDTKIPTPYNLKEGLLYIEKSSVLLNENNNLGIFFVDQFESLFSKPDVYAAFIDMLTDITHRCDNILFCIARKNDQPTTYDERAKIDLEYLREISETVLLEDFSRVEALRLLEHIQDEVGQPLLDKLKEMVLEFSQGFPWLHKRICAHLISLLKKGATQEELVQAGLKPDELFREELSDLDEVELDFLRRLVQYLPATIEELSDVFREGEVLTKRLTSLQHHRLIRLTGRTYDTYNDVLKEYLKTGKIPFAIKYVFRVSPAVTLNLLNRIQTHNWKSLSDIREKERKSKGGILNRLRELRLLGLLEYSKGNIELAEVTVNAFHDGTLGQIVRNRVKQNGLVKDVLDKLAAVDRIKLDQLKDILKSSMPLLDVAEETWETYVKTLSNWLDRMNLAHLVGDNLVLCQDKNAVFQEEFIKGGHPRGLLPHEYFLPSTYIKGLFSYLEFIDKTEQKNQNYAVVLSHKQMEKAIIDCYAMNLVMKTLDQSVKLTPQGKRFLVSSVEAKVIIKDFLLAKPNIVSYLNKIGYNSAFHTKILRETLIEINPEWTNNTWKWRSKVLANWLVYADLIKRKKGKVTSYPVRLFE